MKTKPTPVAKAPAAPRPDFQVPNYSAGAELIMEKATGIRAIRPSMPMKPVTAAVDKD